MNNTFKYAGDGQVVITTSVIAGGSAAMLSITDKGPGIENIELALTNGYSTKGFPGMGLSGAKTLWMISNQKQNWFRNDCYYCAIYSLIIPCLISYCAYYIILTVSYN